MKWLNEVPLNVWALIIILTGALLCVRGFSDVGKMLVVGGFAVFENPLTNKQKVQPEATEAK